ncbi:MAG: acyltransferase, partial [Frankiales bacterium]|nr:acyltransferase [Frankiales bacterium]
MGTTVARHPFSRVPTRRARTPSDRPAADHRRDVEGLRAVAVLLVVASHVLGFPRGGYVGVDVFFVVSGFLITGLLLREHARSGRISLREFYARRVRRLLPAAVLVLAVTNVLASLVFAGERAGQTLRDALWSLGFLANVHFADIGTDYFDQARPPSPVQHYWSLAVEEQFYLVWPLLLLGLLLLAGRRRRTLLLLVAGLSTASLAWSVLLTSADATAAYFSTSARAWELGAGALLAIAQHCELLPRLAARTGSVLAWVGLAGIGAAALLYDARTPFPGVAAALPVAGAALVLLGGTTARRNHLLVNPVSGYLGRLSYSLYLWHWPVLILSTALLPTGPLLIVTALALSLVLAALCHHLVEEPVRRSGWLSKQQPAGRRHASRRPVRAAAVTATAALLLGGWVLPAVALSSTSPPPVAAPAAETDTGLADLTADVAASVAPTSWPALEVPLEQISGAGAPEWIVDRCDNVNAGNTARCTYGSPLAAKRAVLVGDSMAISYLPALRAELEPRGWKIAVLTRNQCPNPLLPLFRTRPSEPFVQCDLHKRFVQEQVARIRPQLVIMSSGITLLDQQVAEPQG